MSCINIRLAAAAIVSTTAKSGGFEVYAADANLHKTLPLVEVDACQAGSTNGSLDHQVI